jgi:hypothetical protein
MPFYSKGLVTVAPAAGAPYLTILTGTRRAKLWELGLSAQTAIAAGSACGLIRPANAPVGTTPELFQAIDPGDVAALTATHSTWTTVPTIGTNVFLRRWRGGAGIGNGFIWSWRNGLVIAATSWLVLWNFGGAAGGVLEGYAEIEE